MQLGGGGREALVPGGRLEGAQGIEVFGRSHGSERISLSVAKIFSFAKLHAASHICVQRFSFPKPTSEENIDDVPTDHHEDRSVQPTSSRRRLPALQGPVSRLGGGRQVQRAARARRRRAGAPWLRQRRAGECLSEEQLVHRRCRQRARALARRAAGSPDLSEGLNTPTGARTMTIPVWVLLGFAGWTLLILLLSVGIYRWSR